MEVKKTVLRLENVSKVFPVKKGSEFTAAQDVSVEIYDNEFVVLLGPGRCGKSVLLNMMAGLEPATSGEISLEDAPLKGCDPRVGMVFQKTGLLPWKTVIDNVSIGPKLRGVGKTERNEIAKKYIDLVGLQGFENAYPSQLSGGMKQRVGIARAYANNPQILLMDEPFGALDAQTRISMENEILRIWEEDRRTIVFVTNNIEEALNLGDRIVLLSKCPATVKEVYNIDLSRPRNSMDEAFLQVRQKISDSMDLAL